MIMSRTRRIQVPVSPEDEKAIKAAARLYKISTAEWMRRIAIKAAQSDLAGGAVPHMTPSEALEALCKMDLPVDSVKKMKEQGIKGRLKP